MDEQEIVDDRPRDMFYRIPTMDVKCTYQNPEVAHVGVDVAEVDFWTSHIGFRSALSRGQEGEIQNCWSKEERKVKREMEKAVALSCTQVHERTKE